MFIKLFILFALLPIIELYVLLKVGAIIGPLNTVTIILITAFIGAYLARQEGFRVIGKINQALKEGRTPTRELLSGVFILIGAFFLLTPGFLTDIAGFTMLIPPIRNIYCKYAGRYIQRKLDLGELGAKYF